VRTLEISRFAGQYGVMSEAEKKRVLYTCGLVAAVSFLAYAPVWNAYFLADDFAYVRLYANRPFADWWAIVAKDWTKGVWGYQFDELRSMMALAFWCDGRFWPFQPLGFHLTNLFFHAASSVMVFLLARTVFAGAFPLSLGAGLLFSLHPVHAEAVSWISGRADPICTFFSLSSLWFFCLYRSRRRISVYLLSLAAFLFALFSKEIAITFPLLPIGFDLFRKKRSGERWSALIPGLSGFFGLLAIYLQIRRLAFPHALREDQLNFAAVREFALRQPAYLAFLFPHVSRWILALLIFGAVAFALFRWKRKPFEVRFDGLGAVLFFGPWWYLACVAPLIVTYTSPRHLYLTSAGVCLLTPALLKSLPSRRLFVVAIVCLCLASGILLVRRNFQWSFAAETSSRARTHIVQLVGLTRPGSGLILDIPEGIGPQYLWLSSLPFVLEPPYSLGGSYQHFRVVERPETYRYWSGSRDGEGKTWIGDRRPVLEDLIAHPADCYVVSMDNLRRIVTTRIKASDVAVRLAPLMEIVRHHKPTDSIFEMNAEWESFWMSAGR
jgi:hypothetical protein